MLDLDNFKRVNDAHGHAIGDDVLRHIAALIRGELRKMDFAGRLGGEEFAIVLPGAEIASAAMFAERLRQKVASTPLTPKGSDIKTTISIGVAALDGRDAVIDAALARADRGLYQAKERGRNRVVVASETAPEI